MIPLLVQLGIALAGGIAQKVAADKQHEKDRSKYNSDTIQDIMNKRAARAGDSMYMQGAISRGENAPKAPPSPWPGVVAGMGSALLGYNGGSAGEAAGSALESALGPQGWSNPAVQGDRAGYDAAKGGSDARPKNPWDHDEWGDGGY
jgi:hypothetical protein